MEFTEDFHLENDYGHLYLNDEVINQYMDLISKRSPKTVYAFNTFFYEALSNKGYSNVCRWTKKIDIFSKTKLFIPILFKNSHWCLVYVSFAEKYIKYYDSMGKKNSECLNLILNYLKLEHYDKKGKQFPYKMVLTNEDNCPQQSNMWDCGVFVCMFAEYLSRDARLNFSQNHMNKFRIQITLEIKKKKLEKICNRN